MLSPAPPIKEKTLSYYFHLDHEEFSPPPSKPKNFLASSSSSVYSTRNAHTSHAPSCAEPGQWKPLLAGSAHPMQPLSWLSTLFSRRKKKPTARSAVAHGSSSPSAVDWEAPRASSWEQLSTWEKPTTSTWDFPSEIEPRRASEACIEELEATMAKHGEVNSLILNRESSDQRRQQKKKWMRNVLAIKWAMKLKRRLMKKRQEEVAREEEASTMSTASAPARRSADYAYHNLHNGQIRGQSDSGLLRFYLTPSRSLKIGTHKQRSYHPLIIGL